MKLDTFINKLLSVGFIQNSNSGASNWYENYVNGVSVFVGIMEREIDCLGHILIHVNYIHDNDEEETEKDYMTTTGAWRAITKLIQ